MLISKPIIENFHSNVTALALLLEKKNENKSYQLYVHMKYL